MACDLVLQRMQNRYTSLATALLVLLSIRDVTSFQVYPTTLTPSDQIAWSSSSTGLFAKPKLAKKKKKQYSVDSKNETIALSSVGKAVNEGPGQNIPDIMSNAASQNVLAIDPSTIKVIPFSELSEETSAVLGGAYSGTDVPLPPESNNSQFGFVNMFRGSANYIANHRNTIIVYHIPGELLSWEGFEDLMDDIALTWLLGMKPVIVVGCRKQIDERFDESDDEDEHSELSPDGRSVIHGPGGAHTEASVRITDIDTLRIVKEEAGFVRFEVERLLGRSLHRHGIVDERAIRDGNVVSGNFYSAQPYGVIDGIDFKYTGFPRKVETEKIKQVLDAHDVVLLTSLGASPSGEMFNVSTEHLASYVAGALGASKVVFFTTYGSAFIETDNKKLVQNLRVSDARNVLKYNHVTVNNAKGFSSFEHNSHMSEETKEAFVKLGWCVSSLERGVKRAHIISPINGALLQELYTRDGGGTLISRDIYEGIRVADVQDVQGIFELIEPLVEAGTLVPRPMNVLERDIKSYFVFTRDNLIVACAQMKLFEDGFSEIGCLVVRKEYRTQGRGDAMLGYLERLSVQVGCSKVFVLSTQTMEWFVERGFKRVTVADLPPSRQEVYNHKRKSKIYMKKIDGDRDLDAAELWWNR